LVYTLFAGLLIVNVLMIPVGLVILRLCLLALHLATPVLVAAVLALCVIGTYAAELHIVNPWTALAFGVLGCGMRAYGFSPAAMVLGMVLGVMAESELRRSLIISHGSWSIFMTRPITAALIVLTVGVLVYPLVLGALRRRRLGRAPAGPATA
jgi:putative tricarboxylic transport membrane protein